MGTCPRFVCITNDRGQGRKRSGAISAVDFVGSLRFGIQRFFEISRTIKAIPLPLGSQSIFASHVRKGAHTAN
jgi:hypothetical protein